MSGAAVSHHGDSGRGQGFNKRTFDLVATAVVQSQATQTSVARARQRQNESGEKMKDADARRQPGRSAAETAHKLNRRTVAVRITRRRRF